MRRLVVIGAVSAVLLASLFAGLVLFTSPAATRNTVGVTTDTTYDTAASSVLDSTSQQPPAGYALSTSPRPLNISEPGLENGGYAVFVTQGGSRANLTVLVFATPSSAQDYMNRVVAGAKALSGYSDISSVLLGYQRYGGCYGFGQDNPFGTGAVATGICTKGNVYIQVHLASPSTLSLSEGDLSSLIGAAYRSIG